MPKNKNAHQTAPADSLASYLSPDPKFDFSIPWVKIAPVYQKILKAAAQKIKQPGFRPGKVPPSLAEELIDKDYLIQEVLSQLASTYYHQALTTQKHRPFTEPEIVVTKAEKNSDWQLTAHLPQKPTIKLPDYKKFIKTQKTLALKQLATAKATPSSQEPKNPQVAATDQALIDLIKHLQPKISPILVRRTAQKELDKFKQELKTHQLNFSDYLKKTHTTSEQIEAQLISGALQNLQLEFTLDALLEAEKITATKKEILAKIATTLPKLTPAEQEKQFTEPTVKNYFTLLVRREKLATWLTNL